MNDEMKMKQEYRAAFNEIHAPEALAGKVKDMSKLNKKKMGSSLAKKCGAVAAVVAVLFVGSNGVAYAATGSTWFKTVAVYMNGDAYEVDLEGKIADDGAVSYSATIEVEEGETPVVITDETEFQEMPYNVTEELPEIVEEDGIIYLKDGDIKIVLTEDLEDGNAAGSYEKDDLVYYYDVTGQDGEWELSISCGDYTE